MDIIGVNFESETISHFINLFALSSLRRTRLRPELGTAIRFLDVFSKKMIAIRCLIASYIENITVSFFAGNKYTIILRP